MKLVITICLVLTTICLFSYSKENEVNYKVTKAILLNQNVTSLKLMTNRVGSYLKTCPDGYIGCGGTSGQPCVGQKNCSPQQILRLYPCPGSSLFGCKANLQTGPECSNPQSCPGENHPSPCDFGSIAFGCFSGSPIGGPSCSPLVNCQTPPD